MSVKVKISEEPYLNEARLVKFRLYQGDAEIGYCKVQYAEHLDPFFSALYIKPEYRRRGFGTLLMRHAESYFKPSQVLTLMAQPIEDKEAPENVLIAFYENLGWVSDADEPCLMTKHLLERS